MTLSRNAEARLFEHSPGTLLRVIHNPQERSETGTYVFKNGINTVGVGAEHESLLKAKMDVPADNSSGLSSVSSFYALGQQNSLYATMSPSHMRLLFANPNRDMGNHEMVDNLRSKYMVPIRENERHQKNEQT
ncbi:hypothetical protein Ciccas_006594 [Cichlidogyrus casuarinus]|uniref:Uncharacterized protein n=1 Tax=Cichlidogyrus casuarinus TaxID=1844966 RepID=A0ABD2Q5W6_9PLAT